jgi:hypothetical protein
MRHPIQLRGPRTPSTSPLNGAARIVARGISRRPPASLAAAMATLGLDRRHPLALEIAGSEQGVAYLVRGADAGTLAHLCRQMLSLYPQAEIHPCQGRDDPMYLDRNEAMTVVELAPRGQPYLSLRTLDAHTWQRADTVGDDPVLAVLGAMQGLPPGYRALAQLALLPDAPQWGQRWQRYAVEHPLEPERERERRRAHASRAGTGPSMGAIIALTMVVAVALIIRRWGRELLPFVPTWVKQDLPLAFRGHLPPLTAPQIMQLTLVVGCIFLFAFAVSRMWNRLRGNAPLYDMKQVADKLHRPAYRARLRLIVIGPARDLDHCHATLPSEGFPPIRLISSLRQRWWKMRATQVAVTRRRAIAMQVAATYRAFSNPTGTTLVPWTRHLRRAHLLARSRSWKTLRRAHRLARLSRKAHPALRHTTTLRCRRFLARACGIGLAQLLQGLLLGKATWQRGIAHARLILSTDELAALWHLVPEQDAPDVAGLDRRLARSRPLPPTLANARAADVLPYRLGDCAHAGQRWPVYAPHEVFHQNSLAVAATGKGKSTLLAHLALAHLAVHPLEGLFFLEPHGDTIAALLGGIPSHRCDDVTLIDLADETTIVGLNPLDMTQGRSRDKTVENILSVFIAFWQKQKSWGARTENILQFALLALAEANLRRIERDGEELGTGRQYTLLDVVPLLQQQGFRKTVLADVRDAVTLSWWNTYYERLRPSFRDEITSSIINKISKYAAAKVSRRLLGQSVATVRISDAIRAGRAILVNTASGVVGEEVSALIGASVVGLFQTSLAEQIRLPREERRRFWVVIDEFQTYLGIDYHTMLAELRKYGGSFALATQSLSYLDEMDRSLRPTVLSNSDQLFAFAMSAEDSRTLAPYLDGLEPSDLVSLDAYTCYARLTLDGRRLPPFSLHIAPPPPWDSEVAALVRNHATERNARPVALVDSEVLPPRPESEPERENPPRNADAPVDEQAETGTPDGLSERKGSASGEGEKSERGKGERGTRGKRGGKHKESDRLSQPLVFTESDRSSPRTVFVPRSAEREESGE